MQIVLRAQVGPLVVAAPILMINAGPQNADEELADALRKLADKIEMGSNFAELAAAALTWQGG